MRKTLLGLLLMVLTVLAAGVSLVMIRESHILAALVMTVACQVGAIACFTGGRSWGDASANAP
jgi:membrane protein DedA with SNARE-associated domain